MKRLKDISCLGNCSFSYLFWSILCAIARLQASELEGCELNRCSAREEMSAEMFFFMCFCARDKLAHTEQSLAQRASKRQDDSNADVGLSVSTRAFSKASNICALPSCGRNSSVLSSQGCLEDLLTARNAFATPLHIFAAL